MDNSHINQHRQLIRITLSYDQYTALMNTKCQGAVMASRMGFKAKLSSDGKHITYEAQGTEDDAQSLYDWADFCCP